MTYEEAKISLMLLGWQDDANSIYWITGHSRLTLYPLDKEIAWGVLNYYPANKQSSKHFVTYQEGIDFLETLDEIS